jgi:hypothetical protein
LGESIDHPTGHAVKTLESKETKAQRNETVTHNSVFAAAHRQMPDDDCKIDIRHCLYLTAMLILIQFDINQNKDTISTAKQSQEIST